MPSELAGQGTDLNRIQRLDEEGTGSTSGLLSKIYLESFDKSLISLAYGDELQAVPVGA